MISSSSRYAQIDRAIYQAPDGRQLPYLRRRFLPRMDDTALLASVTIRAGDRLDLIAAKLQGDPLRAWRIADANTAMNPQDLTSRPGSLLRIPKPGF